MMTGRMSASINSVFVLLLTCSAVTALAQDKKHGGQVGRMTMTSEDAEPGARTDGPSAETGDATPAALEAAVQRYAQRQRDRLAAEAQEKKHAALVERAPQVGRPFFSHRPPHSRGERLPVSDAQANSAWDADEGAPIFASSFPSLILQEKPATQPADKPAKGAQGESSLEEINNKLNNPGSNLASLNFKLTSNQYKGKLGGGTGGSLRGLRRGRLLRNLLKLKRSSRGEGASSQNSLTLNFQPVFPFKLSDGGTIIVRPSFPLVWQPYYNAGERAFDERFGLGDSQLVAFYSRTNAKKGYMWGAGLTMQFPTHTDDVLGKNQFQLGPAAFAGLFGKWGSVGLFPQHFWNIGGSEAGYTALTVVQPWYWFSVGKGYQIGGAPLITYNWAADDSDQAWTVPVNLGVAKTVLLGKTPVKLKFEGIYYIEQPDAFGPHWGLQLTITPVIANPFDGLFGKKEG